MSKEKNEGLQAIYTTNRTYGLGQIPCISLGMRTLRETLARCTCNSAKPRVLAQGERGMIVCQGALARKQEVVEAQGVAAVLDRRNFGAVMRLCSCMADQSETAKSFRRTANGMI